MRVRLGAIIPSSTPNGQWKRGDIVDYGTYYYLTASGQYQSKDGKVTGTLAQVNAYLAGLAINTATSGGSQVTVVNSGASAALPSQYQAILKYFPGAQFTSTFISGGAGYPGRNIWSVVIGGMSTDADVVLGYINNAIALHQDPAAYVEGYLLTLGGSGGTPISLPITSSGTSYTPPSSSNTPPPSSSVAPSVTLKNLTRGDISNFQVGDNYLIAVSGDPNQPVSVTGTHGGTSSSAVMGQTDSKGNFSLVGTMTAAHVGSWTEVWKVAGVIAQPTLAFTVAAAPSSSTPTNPTPDPNQNTDQGSSSLLNLIGDTSSSSSGVPSSIQNAVTDVTQALGSPATWPWWAWAAIAGGGYFLFVRKKR